MSLTAAASPATRGPGARRPGGTQPPARRDAGLTLLEVLAATAIVMVTCAAVTKVTVAASRATGKAQGIAATDRALLAEASRLRALPLFAALPAEWPERREAPVPSAVGELFPHADVALNDDDARFVLSGDVAGAFETTVVVQGITLRRVAWMARCEASGWRRMPPAALDGWCAWGGVAVPGEGLLVRLEASQEPTASPAPGDRASRGLTIVLSAASAPRALDMDALLAGAETERP